MTKIGAHVTGHPRHNYGLLCEAKPRVALLLDQDPEETILWTGGHTTTIFRDTSVYLEAPSDINDPPGTYAEMASYWYPKLKAKWIQNPADYYTITNEQGGGGDDLQAYLNLIEYEREVMRLANQDGLAVCILNLAGGSPESISMWETVLVPFIREAFEAGNIYGRHAYEANWSRVTDEATYLRDIGLGYGGMAITEWGFSGGYGQTHDVDVITRKDTEYQAHSNIIGFCVWELGTTDFNANWDHLIPQLDDWMYDHPSDPWVPGDPPNTKTLEEFLWDESVKEQIARGMPLNANAALQQIIFSDSRTPVHREITPVYNNQGFTIQAGENVQGISPRKTYVWQPGNPVWSFGNPHGLSSDPLAGFLILAPFKVPFVKTSSYGVPRDYPQTPGEDLHEGGDYDIVGGPPDSREPVLCGVSGTVTRSVESTGAYGHYVIVSTAHNGHRIDLWYCHMDAHYVSEGDEVEIGTHLGELGDEGGPWSEHVHINMQVPGMGSGDPKYVIPDTVDPHKYMSMIPQASTKIDLGLYLFPRSGNYGDIAILANNWGEGDERQQLQRDGNVSYVTKNQLWEKRLVAPLSIDLVIDISRGDGEFYTVQGHWLPRHMTPGEVFSRIENVTVYTFTCQVVNRYTQASDIIFAEQFNSRTINGIVLSNVGRFLWRIDGTIEEEYWYAEGLGLVRWLAKDGRESSITELIPLGAQHNNQRQGTPCGM